MQRHAAHHHPAAAITALGAGNGEGEVDGETGRCLRRQARGHHPVHRNAVTGGCALRAVVPDQHPVQLVHDGEGQPGSSAGLPEAGAQLQAARQRAAGRGRQQQPPSPPPRPSRHGSGGSQQCRRRQQQRRASAHRAGEDLRRRQQIRHRRGGHHYRRFDASARENASHHPL